MTSPHSLYPWIVTKRADHAGCLRCGEEMKLDLSEGLSVDTFIALTKTFIEQHKDCREAPATKQAHPEPTRCPDTKDMFT